MRVVVEQFPLISDFLRCVEHALFPREALQRRLVVVALFRRSVLAVVVVVVITIHSIWHLTPTTTTTGMFFQQLVVITIATTGIRIIEIATSITKISTSVIITTSIIIITRILVSKQGHHLIRMGTCSVDEIPGVRER